MAKNHPYVAHVRGTVKGGVDTALAPKTLIVGANGAGKSRIVNAVELALSGYASDVVGRPQMRSGSDLSALAPPGEPLHAVATLSDERGASFRVERKPGGKTARPSHAPIDGLPVVYPAVEVIKALRGSVQSARTFVLRHAGLPITLPGVVEKIPAKLREGFDALHQRHDNSDPVFALVFARDAAAKEAKRAKGEAKALRESLDQGAGAVDRSLPDDTEAARVAVREAAAAYEAARAVPEVVDLHTLYAQAQEALQALQRTEARAAELASLAGQEIAGSGDAAKARHALHTLLSLTASHVPASTTVPCVLCGQTTTVDPTDYRARATALVQAGEHEQAVLEARRLLVEAQEAQQRAQQRAERLVMAYREAHAAQEGAEATQDRNAAIQATYAALTTAEDRLRAMQQAQGRAEEVARMMRDAVAAEGRCGDMDDLATVCGDLVDDLVKDARIGFISRVQQYLPDGDVFDLVLRENKREVCMFGLVRDGALHTALSGAEWARLTLALGAACIPEDDDVLAILTPEERAYDGVTLAAVMRALGKAPGQVILTSPIKPRGRTPRGWTIIEAGSAAEGGDDA